MNLAALTFFYNPFHVDYQGLEAERKKKKQSEDSHLLLPELAEGEIVVDDRFFLIPYPSDPYVKEFAHYLNKKHGPDFLIFNVSEYKYPTEVFSHQVVDYVFPGYPCPPLEAMFTLAKHIQAWLISGQSHVAFIHCQGNHARSCLVIALYLCLNYEQFKKPSEALTEFCYRAKIDREKLFLPSHKQYLNYLDSVFTGFLIKEKPMVLDKIWVNESETCDLYFQIFSKGELAYSYVFKEEEHKRTNEYNIKVPIENDVLIRCKQTDTGSGKSWTFRIYFHTSFIDEEVVTFPKARIDGACNNPEIPEDFEVELKFSEQEYRKEELALRNKYWDAISKICEGKRVRSENVLPKSNKRIQEYVPFVIEETKEEKKESKNEIEDVELVVERVTNEVLNK